jgi:hypothetical protein
LLTQDEDELIAEDDLYWDSLPVRPVGGAPGEGGDGSGDGVTRTADMLASQGMYKGTGLERELARLGVEDDAEEIRERLVELMMEKKQASLKALVHFLYDGGSLPDDFGAHEDADAEEGREDHKFMGGINSQRDLHARWDAMWKKAGGRGVLEELKELGEDEEEMFDHDWKKVNEEKLKLVLFSKVSTRGLREGDWNRR